MSQDNNFSQGPVPQSARKGVLTLTFVMPELTFFSASIRTGGTLGAGLNYHDFFLIVLIGNLLLGICTLFLSCIGTKTGLTTHLLVRFSFGVKDSWLPSLLLGDTQVDWFGVGVAMFSIPVGEAIGLDINSLITISGLLMTITVFFDIPALTVLPVIAASAVACLGGYSVWLAVNGVGDLNILRTVVLAQPLDFNVAPALVVGSFISVGMLAADFVRSGRNAKLMVLAAMVAFPLGNSLVFIFDVAGAAALGMADISDVIIAQGLLPPAIMVLGPNIWAIDDNTPYASGLGFASIVGMSNKTLSVVNGITGTVCALWLCNNPIGWLTLLSVAIPLVGDAIAVGYLMNRRRYEHFTTTRMMSVSRVAILMVAPEIATGHWSLRIVPVNAVLGGALSHSILNPVLNRKTTAAMAHVEANGVE